MAAKILICQRVGVDNMPELQFPFKGKHVGLPGGKQPPVTSPDLNNMRPMNPKSGRVTGAQRPPLSKKHTEQVASEALPIVAMCSVTTVEII